MSEKMTFEEAMEKLEEVATSLDTDEITLKEALENYKKGLEYYSQCDAILKEAKQTITTYRSEES